MNTFNKSDTTDIKQEKKIGFDQETRTVETPIINLDSEIEGERQLFNQNKTVTVVTASLEDVKSFKDNQLNFWQKLKRSLGTIPKFEKPNTLQRIILVMILIPYLSHVYAFHNLIVEYRHVNFYLGIPLAITMGLIFEGFGYLAGRMRLISLSWVMVSASFGLSMWAYKEAFYLNNEFDYFNLLLFTVISIIPPVIALLFTEKLELRLDEMEKARILKRQESIELQKANPELKTKSYNREKRFNDREIQVGINWIMDCFSRGEQVSNDDIQKEFNCGSTTAKKWKVRATSIYDDKRQKLAKDGSYVPPRKRAKKRNTTTKQPTATIMTGVSV